MRTSLELHPVVELAPSDYGHAGRACTSALPEDQDAHWRASLADAGIFGLTAITGTTWCVDVETLTSPLVLERLLRSALSRCDARGFGQSTRELLEDQEAIPPLNGGYALLIDAAVVLAPGCCNDLGDLDAWRSASEHDDVLAIGHGTVSVRSDNGILFIEERKEYGGGTRVVATTHEALRDAVACAERQRAKWATYLLPVLEACVQDDARAGAICDFLLGR